MTPAPVTVSVASLLAVIVTESEDVALLVLICATVLLLSTIRSASTIILAVSTFGIPADQLAALDHKLSPPALLKVDSEIFLIIILPTIPECNEH